MGFSKLFSCFKKQSASTDATQVNENPPVISATESTPILDSRSEAIRARRSVKPKYKTTAKSSSGYLAFSAYKAQSSRGGESGASAGCDTADPSARTPVARE